MFYLDLHQKRLKREISPQPLLVFTLESEKLACHKLLALLVAVVVRNKGWHSVTELQTNKQGARSRGGCTDVKLLNAMNAALHMRSSF